MSLTRVEDVTYVRFRAPDLGLMQEFLEDFGMVHVPSNDGRLYMRGFGHAPFLHATELGEPGFAGLGLRAANMRDLEILAKAEGADIQKMTAPGGGSFVHLTDPDGFSIEVVTGQTLAAPLALPTAQAWNQGAAQLRLRKVKRIAKAPAHALRLGHCVLNVTNFRESERWYKDRFGLLTSDEIAINPDLSIGAFMRADRGDDPSDHHTVFLLQHPGGKGFNHAAFEVADLDDLMAGHGYLKAKGRDATWGIGRHLLGSQVFDYWRDPWGHMIEHWTDGDVFTADDPPGIATFEDLTGVQWGPAMPANV